LSYRELAEELVPYVRDMGFTHVQFLPVMEHPFMDPGDISVSVIFAPSSRFGARGLHGLGGEIPPGRVGVILDWVPSHFPVDGHGLGLFDGTHLFEYADPRKGFIQIGIATSSILEKAKCGVFSSVALSSGWSGYHADGLRVDAVASMLYLDYSRKDGEWIPNELVAGRTSKRFNFSGDSTKPSTKGFQRLKPLRRSPRHGRSSPAPPMWEASDSA
jgi:1,4-alpha-glucan branching enzyme